MSRGNPPLSDEEVREIKQNGAVEYIYKNRSPYR